MVREFLCVVGGTWATMRGKHRGEDVDSRRRLIVLEALPGWSVSTRVREVDCIFGPGIGESDGTEVFWYRERQ